MMKFQLGGKMKNTYLSFSSLTFNFNKFFSNSQKSNKIKVLRNSLEVNSSKIQINNASNLTKKIKIKANEKVSNSEEILYKHGLSNDFINKINTQFIPNKNNEFKEYLIEKIKKNPLTISQYFNECLFNPQYGYYSTKDHIFGEKGDFVTSPEISQMFGEMITVFLLKQLEIFKNPNQFEICEIGPGRGYLASDIINSLISLNKLFGCTYYLIEKSDKLRKVQQEYLFNVLISKLEYEIEYKVVKIGEYSFINNCTTENIDYLKVTYANKEFKVVWFKSIEDYINVLNSKIKRPNFSSGVNFNNISHFALNLKEDKTLNPLIIIANELFDALPIDVFVCKKGNWKELKVDVEEESANIDFNYKENSLQNFRNEYKENTKEKKLVFKEFENTDNLKNFDPQNTFKDIDLKKENFKYEFSVDSIKMMAYINILLSMRHYASSLIIDYGENSSFENSIRGILNQKIIRDDEILKYSGECDLSAYVNFKLLIAVTRFFHSLDFAGLMKQGDFLELLGIGQRANNLIENASSNEQKLNLQLQFTKLCDPDEMGDNFKVLYIKKRHQSDIYPFLPEILEKLN